MAEPYAPLLTRLALLGGGEETTAGTLPTITTPLASTSIYDATLQPLELFADGQRRPIGGYLGADAAVPGRRIGQLTFKQQLRYGDQFVALLTGAGYKLTGGVYAPTSDMASRKTWGFKLWENGRVKALAGAVGNCVLDIRRGAPTVANWTWRGVWQAPADAAMPSSSPIAGFPWVGTGMTFTLAAVAAPHNGAVQVDLGNTIADIEDITKTGAIAYCVVTDRLPKVTLETAARLIAQLDTYGLMLAGTEVALNLVLTDATHTLAIAAPKLQRLGVRDQDKQGVRIDALETQCNRNAGDDELTFAVA